MLLSGLILVSCTRANPDFCDAEQPCAGDRVCDLAGVLGSRNACVTPICAPGEVLSCDGTRAEQCADNLLETNVADCEFGCNDAGCLPCPAGGRACREVEPGLSEVAVCGEDGSVLDRRDCVLGCVDSERCTDIVPSNDLDNDLGFIDGNLEDIVDLELGDGFTVHSDGTITDADDQPITAPSSRERMPGIGPTMRVFRVRELSVTGEVALTGPDVIAFVANGDIRINGLLVVRSGSLSDAANDCVGEPGTQLSEDAGGGGGGGFESNGGRGGDVGGIGGGNGGQSFGNSTLIPLFGGCAGGGDMGGRGGGGLQLVSRSRIVLEPGAGINAGGRGGSAPVSVGVIPPGGGGSGGGVLLEAPVIDVAETAFVAANGGGGGCTGLSVSQSGADGELGAAQALGGDCASSNFGLGGDGGSKADNRDNGQDRPSSASDDSGGGGGGSVGRIRVNSILGVPSSSRFSPDPSVGTLDSF